MNKTGVFDLFKKLSKLLILKKKNELNIFRSIRSDKLKGAYIGWVGYDNLGDEILYQAHLKLFPPFDLLPYESNSLIEKYFLLMKKEVYNFGVLGGGTLINQNNRWQKEIMKLQKKRIPLFCLGTGVASEDFWKIQCDEPWNNSISTWIEILSSFLFVGVRGPISKKILIDNGLKNVVVVGDTALSLAPDTYTKKESGRVIGINFGIVKGNPMLGDPDEFIKQMVSLIKYLLLKNYKIILLPVWREDIPSNIKMQKEIDSENCILKNCCSDFTSYSEQLEKCDIFIGQKLHSVVLACMFRIPSLMIEYDPKCRDFMASLDLEENIIRTTDFKLDKVKKHIDNLFENREKIQEKLNEKVIMYKKIQEKYARNISDKLTKKA
jgi:polysaccharide pyruvyl transferase WcaK-like protein